MDHAGDDGSLLSLHDIPLRSKFVSPSRPGELHLELHREAALLVALRPGSCREVREPCVQYRSLAGELCLELHRDGHLLEVDGALGVFFVCRSDSSHSWCGSSHVDSAALPCVRGVLSLNSTGTVSLRGRRSWDLADITCLVLLWLDLVLLQPSPVRLDSGLCLVLADETLSSHAISANGEECPESSISTSRFAV